MAGDGKRAYERTSYEVRRKWDKENYISYTVRLRKTQDESLIEYIETRKAKGEGITDIFRQALEKLKNEGV